MKNYRKQSGQAQHMKLDVKQPKIKKKNKTKKQKNKKNAELPASE